jgi:hypothetical protein
MSAEDPLDLLRQLNLLRSLVDSPTKMPPKDQRQVQREAQRLGDRCWANVGWYASKTRGELTGSSSAPTISAEMASLIERLQSHGAKPKRKRGRPSKGGGVDFLAEFVLLPEFSTARRRGKTQEGVVDGLIKRRLLSATTTPEGHIKRLRRMEKKDK